MVLASPLLEQHAESNLIQAKYKGRKQDNVMPPLDAGVLGVPPGRIELEERVSKGHGNETEMSLPQLFNPIKDRKRNGLKFLFLLMATHGMNVMDAMPKLG